MTSSFELNLNADQHIKCDMIQLNLNADQHIKCDMIQIIRKMKVTIIISGKLPKDENHFKFLVASLQQFQDSKELSDRMTIGRG